MTSVATGLPTLLIAPSTTDEHQERCLKAARRTLQGTDGHPPPTLRAQRTPVQGNGWGRYAELLQPRDAIAVYRRLHQEPVLVLAFDEVWVRRNPERNPPTRRAAIPLSRFVQYKASYGRVHRESDINRHVATYWRWVAAVACDGDDDARVLPLPAFSTYEDWPQLDSVVERQAFKNRYGPARERSDAEGRRWRKPYAGGMHGWDQSVRIAGRLLSRGLHWDVDLPRGRAKLYTPNEIWEIGAGAYVNVSPASNVRLTRDSNARRLWPRQAGSRRGR
jgi:hypothetical protein